MPIIDGKVVRSRYTMLKLGELSSVDNPAQPGALAVIHKRAEPDRDSVFADIAKYVGCDDGAHTFAEVLRENKFSEQIWPYTDALSQSIRSIVGDTQISGADREEKINASVSEFLAAVRLISPDTAAKLEPLIKRRDDPMADKTVAELEKQVADLTGQLTSANALAASEKARADAAEKGMKDAKDELDKEKTDHAATKVKLTEATDETIKVGDQEIKKSVVGDGPFALSKTLANERTMAQLEKRAATDFPLTPGTPAEKALVLKLVDGKPEDDATRKALETVLSATEKMLKAGFGRLGTSGGQTETAKAAEDAFMAKVAEIQKRDECKEYEAMEKARTEHPALFDAYQNGGATEVPAN